MSTDTHPPLGREAAELIVTAQQQMYSTERALNQLVQMIERTRRPAQLREATLGAAVGAQKWNDEAGDTALSVGFYNPSPAVVYTTINGGAPEPGRDSLSIPKKSLLVLPLTVTDLTLGIDPADAGLPAAPATITVYVLRFETVQPATLTQFA